MSILKVTDVKKHFSDEEVLKGISFQLEAGNVLAIIGPSGSGKSTLLRCITQLERVDSGSIEISNMTLVKNNDSGLAEYADRDTCRQIGLKIGLVFQNFNLFPHFSVLKNITDAPVKVLKLSRADAEERAKALLEKMGLSDKAAAYPCQLSGGQSQRVSIARALALSPDILFFDEPTSALDPELTGEILKVMKQLASEKMTMVVVTHEMSFAHDVADYVIFMDKGVIVDAGTPKEVFEDSRNERTLSFLERYNS